MDAYEFSLLYSPSVINPNAIYNNIAGSVYIHYTYPFWNYTSPVNGVQANYNQILATTIKNNYWGGGPSNANFMLAPSNCCAVIGVSPNDANFYLTPAANCTFQPSPDDPTGYDPAQASARLSNTTINVPVDLQVGDLASLEPAAQVYLTVYRRMLQDQIEGTTQLLAEHLSEASPEVTPDAKFSVTQAMAAMLANQLYHLNPCEENAWSPQSYRTAQNISSNTKNSHSSRSQLSEIKVQPNPLSNSTVIYFSNGANEMYDLKVISEIGQVVYANSTLQGNMIKLDGLNWAAGIYTVFLTSATHHYTTKLIVAKK